MNKYNNEANTDRLRKVQRLSAEYSVSVGEIVLSYMISQPFTTIPIVGCKTEEHLKESMRAADLQLPTETVCDLAG